MNWNVTPARGATVLAGHPWWALLIACAAIVLCSAGLAADAHGAKVKRHATETVRKWSSPKAYRSPYAKVTVRHAGQRLSAMPVSNCKAHFADEEVDVLISSCGKRWRLRAKYVSLTGSREKFTIAYKPHG